MLGTAYGRGLFPLLLPCLLIVPARSEAQGLAGGRVVVVRTDAAHASEGAALEAAVMRGLLGRGLAAEPPPPATAEAPIDRDDEALARARSAFAGLHPVEAEAEIEAILGRAASLGARNLGRAGLVEALLLRARAALALGRTETFAECVAAIDAIAPTLELSPAEYPPAFLRAVSDARAGAPPPSEAVIDWSGVPDDLELWVDGERVAPPSRVVRVRAGSHYLYLARPGYVSRAQMLELSGDEVYVPPPLEEDPVAALRLARDLSRPRDEVLRASRTLQRCLLLIELRFSAEALSVWAADPCDEHRVRLQRPPGVGAEALASAIVEALFRAAEPPLVADDEAMGPARRRRAIGAAAAIVGAAVILSAVLATTRSDAPSGFTISWSRKGPS